jgi:Right handed beta helix region
MPDSLPYSTRADGKPTVIRICTQGAPRYRQWPLLFVTALLLLVPRASTFGQDEFSSQRLTGTSYYVDSVAGNDQNGGTSAGDPWKTLAKVNERTFSGGDTILFKSGAKWTGQLWPKGSGTEQRPIVIDKYGGEAKPILEGEGHVKSTLLLKNQQYWEINNLEITNRGDRPRERRGVQLEANNYGDMHHIYLRSLTIHDVNGVDKTKVNGGINYTSEGASKPSRFVDLRIENNRIYHVDRSGIFGWSSHWMRSQWYPSLGVVVRGNTLDDIGGDGIVVVATDGAIIENNVVSRANQRSSGYNIGIWPWSADNTVVQFNEVYGTRGQRDGEGFDSDWNSRNTLIQYNYSHGNDGGFLLICNEGGMDPRTNIGNTGTVARYNISQNDHHRGINIAGPVRNSKIYNNTIYVGKDEKVDLVLHSDWKGWANGTYLFNNIFYVDGAGQFSYAISRKKDGAHVTQPGFGRSTQNIFDSNVYFGVSAADDPHALTSDPRVARPGEATEGRQTAIAYTLRSDSPAIDSGKVFSDGGGKDFLGIVVPSCGGVDRGALEYDACQRPASRH